VLCAANLDTVGGNDLDSVKAGLARAADRGEVIHLYTHVPDVTVPRDKLEATVTEAARLGLRFVTYPDLVDGPDVGGAVALSFDDSNVESWISVRDLLRDNGVRATFFVTRYHTMGDSTREQLRQLAADGHTIEAHTVNHLHAADYVDQHGLAQYLREEAVPSIERLRADGFPVRAFAYPFGERTRELDRALLKHVEVLRAVSFSADNAVIVDPPLSLTVPGSAVLDVNPSWRMTAPWRPCDERRRAAPDLRW
jgi:peptidoglycan/xylan/chitin deacetylase (PgdA/CDA1 family)